MTNRSWHVRGTGSAAGQRFGAVGAAEFLAWMATPSASTTALAAAVLGVRRRLRRCSQAPATVSRNLRARAQRAHRGWADIDTWSLDTTLCRTLAGQLTHLADTTHGWPGREPYPTPEDWDTALRTAAAGLNGWAGADSRGTEFDTVYETTGGQDSLLLRQAIAADMAVEEELLAQAQVALHWVADNLALITD
jgi:hypothetical protein